MSFYYRIEAQCELCGRFEEMYRGDRAARQDARARAKAKGWNYIQKGDVHVCPECRKKPGAKK